MVKTSIPLWEKAPSMWKSYGVQIMARSPSSRMRASQQRSR